MTAAREITFDEYKMLVEQAPIMIWRADTSSACDYFNERWLAFTGRTFKQELGDGWAEGVHPDDLQKCVGIYRAAFDKRDIFEMEYRLRRHDGVYRWLFDRGVPCYLADGSFTGYIGSCTDVTEKKDAEELLRKATEAEIVELRKLIPVCASCKKVRNDAGYWESVETYIRQKIGKNITHGVCPDCVEKMLRESGQ
jgi:PAS domain S-box-containing protein